MEQRLRDDILRRLESDHAFKRHGGFLQQGECPSCGKKELWTSAEHPWVLRCNRINNCGYEGHVKDNYRDLFESWSERHPRTPENPRAAAEAYLSQGRGFALDKLAGCYTQDSYWDHDKEIGSATVRFAIAPGVYWERLIDRPERFGKRKANFVGQYGGLWWLLPGAELTSVDEIWIAEGIFDAVALEHHGVRAVAALSTVNYPDKALAQLAQQIGSSIRPRLVWAFDGDKAGRSFTKKWVTRARSEGWNATAAQIPQTGKKRDWNDLHQLDKLDAKALDTYRHHGALLLAESAMQKAVLMYGKTDSPSFHFDFDNHLYWFKLDLDDYVKARDRITSSESGPFSDDEIRELALQESGAVIDVANCRPEALYFQQNKITDESWYYFRVTLPDERELKNTFTGGQLAASSEFKKRLLSIAPGAVWTGNAGQLDVLVKRWLSGIKTVDTIDFIGYAKEHSTYVFGDLAVCNGKRYDINDEDFFEIGKLSLKSLSQSLSLQIEHDPKKYRDEWLTYIWSAFGAKGIVALTFWFGSLFAEQIRGKNKFYPFLEIVGEAGAGKTTLIEFLWKLCGRVDYEGIDPSKATAAARARTFAQTSNLPVVLIESDREHVDSAAGRPVKNFDWDELKTAYNGRSVRSRGMKNGGNETYEPPFRGSIVIAQNNTVSASEAILQRICHLHFTRAHHNDASKLASAQLSTMPIERVSAFILRAAQAERDVLEIFDTRFSEYDRYLSSKPDIRNFRIAANHAMLLALVDALHFVLPMSDEMKTAAKNQIEQMAVERQQAISADHPLVQEFWEAFDFLDGDGFEPQLNHSRDASVIAVNLNHFEQVASEHKIKTPALAEIKRVLKTSRARKFVDIKTVNSAIYDRHNRRLRGSDSGRPTTLKCWVFEPESKR